MDISVIIVNYRVKYFLEQTLLSVQEALQGLDGEVLVIDNASGDDSLAFLRPRFPDVRFIANEENVGFARANNIGISQAKGDYTLILNPDTIVTRESILKSLERIRTDERCGAIGVRMLDGNGNFLPESKRAFPTPWVSFCKIFGLSRLFPNSPRFAKYHLRYLDEHESHQIEILAGAFMLCRTDVLQRIGGFDDDFFMYGEDIDLSYRIVKQGFKNYYLPLNIIHYKGESTKKDSMRYVQVFYDAMLIFYRKHYPHYSVVFGAFVRMGVGVRKAMAIAKRLLNRIFPHNKAKKHEYPQMIVSDYPESIAEQLGIKDYTTSLPENGEVNVILDDGSLSFSEIVAYIDKHHNKRVNFSIYSHRNHFLITPKMQQM